MGARKKMMATSEVAKMAKPPKAGAHAAKKGKPSRIKPPYAS